MEKYKIVYMHMSPPNLIYGIVWNRWQLKDKYCIFNLLFGLINMESMGKYNKASFYSGFNANITASADASVILSLNDSWDLKTLSFIAILRHIYCISLVMGSFSPKVYMLKGQIVLRTICLRDFVAFD